MPKARKKHATHQQPPDPTAGLPPLNLNAAGIDVGSAEHDGAVPPDRSSEPVRRCASLTAALHALADWLHACRIDTVVMASTGVYGIALFPLLEARGFDVHLVHARQATHLPGRKPDIADGQWRQQLHTVGLLNRSCRPTADICVLRSYVRQRDTLISGVPGIQHRYKALTAMNVHRANVLSDLSGVPGMAIICALRDGARDPVQRATFKDSRLKASQQTLATSLEGNWRAEVLFNRRQSLQLSACDQQKIAQCDRQLEAHRHPFDSTSELPDHPPPTSRRRSKTARRHEPTCDLPPHLSRISGADLPRLDGIEVLTAPTLIAEIGLDMSRWKTAQHFPSWLGVGPDHRLSGGTVLNRGTRDVVNRAADALRLAAHHLLHSKRALGANYRCLRARLGAPKAITARAHTLARLLYRMLKFGQPYVDQGLEHDEARFRPPRLQWLQRQARALNLQLVPHQPVRSAVP